MAELDTTSIRAKADAATSGPWKVKSHGSHVWVASDTAKYADGALFVGNQVDQDILSDEDYPTKEADAEFVVACRDGVPALCDEVDRLRKALRDIVDFDHAEDCPAIAERGYTAIPVYECVCFKKSQSQIAREALGNEE